MTMQRLNVDNPADLIKLVNSGLIWKSVVPAAFKQQAIEQIADGTVTPSPHGVDEIRAVPGLLAHINEQRNQQGLPPLGEAQVTSSDSESAADQNAEPGGEPQTEPLLPPTEPAAGNLQPNQPEAAGA